MTSPFVDITKPFLESKADTFVEEITNFVVQHLDYQPELRTFVHAKNYSKAYVLIFASGTDAMLFKLAVVW